MALFAAELERIDAAIGYNNIVQDQHHTTIEKVAQLTSVLEGSLQNPHPQSILLDNQIAENSNNNISVIQGFDSGLESTRLSREELLDTVEIIPAQAEFNANPTSSSIPRWKQRARKSTSTINQPQNQVEHSGTNKRTREEEEHSESGEKPSTKRRTIQDRDTDTTSPPDPMSLLSLNCRGLGNPQTVRELHALVKQEGPALVFLLETRLEVKNLDPLRIKLGFHGVVGLTEQVLEEVWH